MKTSRSFLSKNISIYKENKEKITFSQCIYSLINTIGKVKSDKKTARITARNKKQKNGVSLMKSYKAGCCGVYDWLRKLDLTNK